MIEPTFQWEELRLGRICRRNWANRYETWFCRTDQMAWKELRCNCDLNLGVRSAWMSLEAKCADGSLPSQNHCCVWVECRVRYIFTYKYIVFTYLSIYESVHRMQSSIYLYIHINIYCIYIFIYIWIYTRVRCIVECNQNARVSSSLVLQTNRRHRSLLSGPHVFQLFVFQQRKSLSLKRKFA